MKADRAAIIAAINRFDPTIRVIVLHGADTSASSDLATQLGRQFDNPNDPIGETIIAASTLIDDPAALQAATSEVSMFGGTRLIRVNDAGEDVLPAINLVLNAAVTGNPVVIVAGILKKGSKLLGRVENETRALCHVNYIPDAAIMTSSVLSTAAEYGIRPTRAAVTALVSATGNERGVIRQELIKLALYLDATSKIQVIADINDIAAIGADLGEADFSALIDGVAGGHPNVADDQFTRFTAAGVPAIVLIRAIARRFWLLLGLRQLVDGGVSATRVVESARPPVFWKERPVVAAQLTQWQTPAIRIVLARLLAVERFVKQKDSPGNVAVGQLLLGIAAQVREN